MKVGDYALIRRIPGITIEHPLCAKVVDIEHDRVELKIISGGYETLNGKRGSGQDFRLSWPDKKSDWTSFTEDEVPGEVWASIATRKLLGGED